MHDHEGKEKGAGGPAVAGGSPRKTRRATGPIATDFLSFLSVMHAAFRDCQELISSGEMSSAEAFGFLADLTQLEYDKRLPRG